MYTRRKFLGAAALGLFGGAVPLRLRKQFGLEVQASTPRALAELLKADAAEWSGLAKETGFTADS